jgi:RES domain-containing protein
MRAWRISRQAYAGSLTGRGGLYVSGRWHHQGWPVVYTSATPSLAALEVLVHVDPGLAPTDLRLIEIDVPDGIDTETCDPTLLTADWQRFPAPVALQDFGTEWLSSLRTPVLTVPSAVLAIERNYLINPAHPDASRIRIVREQAFSFDPRLIKSI